jgi:hypothetical protein
VARVVIESKRIASLRKNQGEALVMEKDNQLNTSNIGQFIFIVEPYVSDHHDKSLSGSECLIV